MLSSTRTVKQTHYCTLLKTIFLLPLLMMVYTKSGNQRDVERELKQVRAKIQLKKNQIKLLEIQKEILEDNLKMMKAQSISSGSKFDCEGKQIRKDDSILFALSGKFHKNASSFFLDKGFVSKINKALVEIVFRAPDGKLKFVRRSPQNIKVV